MAAPESEGNRQDDQPSQQRECVKKIYRTIKDKTGWWGRLREYVVWIKDRPGVLLLSSTRNGGARAILRDPQSPDETEIELGQQVFYYTGISVTSEDKKKGHTNEQPYQI